MAGLEQDRRYAGWKAALAQARWFIDGECPNIYSGKNDSISILFDMSKLFERYVAIEVSSLLSPAGYSIQCQGPPLWLLSIGDMSRFKTIPDLFVTKDGRPIAILDTKWKMLNGSTDGADIAQSDLYQLFTYAKAYHVSDVALIYPSSYGQVNDHGCWKYMDGMTSLYVIRTDITALRRGRQDFRDELSRSGLEALFGLARSLSKTPA